MESPSIYYIYDRGSIIYNLQQLNPDTEFLIICDQNFQIPEEFEKYVIETKNTLDYHPNIIYDNCRFIFRVKEYWFNAILNCDIEAWECSCLPKKFIYKEYIKLPITVNSLYIREKCELESKLGEVTAKKHFLRCNYYEGKKVLWAIIKTYAFANQIIENHKITDFKEVNDIYNKLVLNDSIDGDLIFKYYFDFLQPYKEKLEILTNDVLRRSKLKKIIQNERK